MVTKRIIAATISALAFVNDQRSRYMEYIPENSADGELTNHSTYNNHGTKSEQMKCIKESGNGIVATRRQCNSNEFCAVFTEYTYILRPSQQYEDIKEVWKVTRQCHAASKEPYHHGSCVNSEKNPEHWRNKVTQLCICDAGNLCNDWTLRSLQEKLLSMYSFLESPVAGNTVDYPLLDPTKRNTLPAVNAVRMRCYRCTGKIAYEGGPHENDANAGCDSHSKQFMDDNYRSSTDCRVNEICYAVLRQGSNQNQPDSRYFSVDRGCMLFEAHFPIYKGCYGKQRSQYGDMDEIYCSCKTNYCNDWTFASLKNRFLYPTANDKNLEKPVMLERHNTTTTTTAAEAPISAISVITTAPGTVVGVDVINPPIGKPQQTTTSKPGGGGNGGGGGDGVNGGNGGGGGNGVGGNANNGNGGGVSPNENGATPCQGDGCQPGGGGGEPGNNGERPGGSGNLNTPATSRGKGSTKAANGATSQLDVGGGNGSATTPAPESSSNGLMIGLGVAGALGAIGAAGGGYYLWKKKKKAAAPV